MCVRRETPEAAFGYRPAIPAPDFRPGRRTILSGYYSESKPGRLSRKAFLGIGRMSAAALMLGNGPLQSLGARAALGQEVPQATGYGPLVLKTDGENSLRLPAAFNFQTISRRGDPQRDGNPTPGIFDAMGAYPDAGGGVNPTGGTTILIRNHENRERPGEIKVTTGPAFEYDETAFGGCTKLVVRQTRSRDARGQEAREYGVVDSFNILGGTSTNCAGGELPFKKWMTCEEVVKRTGTGEDSLKHGYNFEVDAMSDGPVKAVPIPQMGRFVHEATAWRSGILYQTEDRSLQADPIRGTIGSSLYRYIPDGRVGQSGSLAETTGPLEALAIKGQPHFNADAVVTVGVPFPVEWVPVPEPDHDDDTDNRRDRVPNFTPTRIQAQDNGAAYFDRQGKASGFRASGRARRSTSTAPPGGRRTSGRCGSTIRAARRSP